MSSTVYCIKQPDYDFVKKYAAYDDLEKVKKLVGDGHVDINYQAPHGDTALLLAACHGNVEMVRYLLDNHADPNLQNSDGDTAL